MKRLIMILLMLFSLHADAGLLSLLSSTWSDPDATALLFGETIQANNIKYSNEGMREFSAKAAQKDPNLVVLEERQIDCSWVGIVLFDGIENFMVLTPDPETGKIVSMYFEKLSVFGMTLVSDGKLTARGSASLSL